jgi:hypothetical protein
MRHLLPWKCNLTFHDKCNEHPYATQVHHVSMTVIPQWDLEFHFSSKYILVCLISFFFLYLYFTLLVDKMIYCLSGMLLFVIVILSAAYVTSMYHKWQNINISRYLKRD